jgi:hypothetical protein
MLRESPNGSKRGIGINYDAKPLTVSGLQGSAIALPSNKREEGNY